MRKKLDTRFPAVMKFMVFKLDNVILGLRTYFRVSGSKKHLSHVLKMIFNESPPCREVGFWSVLLGLEYSRTGVRHEYISNCRTCHDSNFETQGLCSKIRIQIMLGIQLNSVTWFDQQRNESMEGTLVNE